MYSQKDKIISYWFI